MPLGFTPPPPPAKTCNQALISSHGPCLGACTFVPAHFLCYLLLSPASSKIFKQHSTPGPWVLGAARGEQHRRAPGLLESCLNGRADVKEIAAQLAVHPPGGEGQRRPRARGTVCRRPALSTQVSSRDVEVAWGRTEQGAACGGCWDGGQFEEEGTRGARPDRCEAGHGGSRFSLRARKSPYSGLNCGAQKIGPRRTSECDHIWNRRLCRWS